jgi:hypothetical protein
MKPEDKKYMWWGLLGIGVAALFYFLSQSQNSQNQSGGGQLVNVPYLVPQYSTSASPSANSSLSTQPNIIGSSSNSTIPNYSNPYAVSANPTEAPGTWGFMPALNVSNPTGPNNSVQFGAFNQPPGVIQQNGTSTPGSNYNAPNTNA